MEHRAFAFVIVTAALGAGALLYWLTRPPAVRVVENTPGMEA